MTIIADNEAREIFGFINKWREQNRIKLAAGHEVSNLPDGMISVRNSWSIGTAHEYIVITTKFINGRLGKKVVSIVAEGAIFNGVTFCFEATFSPETGEINVERADGVESFETIKKKWLIGL